MLFSRIFNFASHDMAIDLGTVNTVVYLRDKGIVLNEASVVAIETRNGVQKVRNVGNDAKLMMGKTPAGIQAIFVHYGVEIAGREVCVVGRGPTLGRPLSLLLTMKRPGANAAVTVVHTGVKNLADYTRRADIVVAAAGVPSCVTGDMVKPGAIVVSGGISWEGRKLLADVDESVNDVASWVTPRLGGVGPTTVAMLLRNTVEAAERSTF